MGAVRYPDMAKPSGNLPAETASFVGRRRELAEVRKKLTEARLVSLVGPGGVGKTRLAVRIATDLGRGFSGGSWLVELAEIGDAALVSQAVMTALGLRDQAAAEPLALLLAYLRDQELLLVVDNCEHLLEAAAQVVTEVLRVAPGVRVMVTSREPLSVDGEYVVPVPPLDLPAPGATEPLAQLGQNEAVTLFTQRAAAASGGFELTAANQAAVVDLCRRLDGLPLAIELAAVRMRVLSVEQLVARLADRFALLTSGSRAALPRHQTLRTTIEWSHDLLPDGERTVLRRLCAFAGRFTLDDVESVCAPGPGQVLDVLASLVDKSLVMKEDAKGQACYRLHETMREFARLKLDEAGETETTELRCTEYYRYRCARSALDGRYRLADWLEWADLEIDNVRAVLRRCLTQADGTSGIELAACMGWYWITRATTEGMRWLDDFLAYPGGDPVTRGWAYFIRGFLAVLKADPAAAYPPLLAAVTVARQAGQPALLTEALSMAANAHNLAGEHATARRLLNEAQAATDPAYPPGQLAVLQARCLGGSFEADFGAVRAAATEGARLAEETGDTYALEMMLLNLGSVALLTGELEEAKPLLARSLRMARQIDDRVAQFYLLGVLGCHAARRGRGRLAAQLLGAADAARTEVGANVMPFIASSLAQAEASASVALGAARFKAEFQAGCRLGREAAIDLALGTPAREAEPGGTQVLGKREVDVARLVADGLTNKQIGTRLFISERTVDSHVRSILNKLGFSSRAQIAAWVAGPDSAV